MISRGTRDFWALYRALPPAARGQARNAFLLFLDNPDHPSLNFYPAMRFNPSKTVNLYMYAPNVSPTDAKNWLMSYCPDLGGCIDESLTDTSLSTVIDYDHDMLFRRVKHFSGYTVAERSDDGSISSQ